MNSCMKSDGDEKSLQKVMRMKKGRLWAVGALRVTPAETWLTVYRRLLVLGAECRLPPSLRGDDCRLPSAVCRAWCRVPTGER